MEAEDLCVTFQHSLLNKHWLFTLLHLLSTMNIFLKKLSDKCTYIDDDDKESIENQLFKNFYKLSW